MIGSVTRERYDELVRLGRDWVTAMSSVQWRLGVLGDAENADGCGTEGADE